MRHEGGIPGHKNETSQNRKTHSQGGVLNWFLKKWLKGRADFVGGKWG